MARSIRMSDCKSCQKPVQPSIKYCKECVESDTLLKVHSLLVAGEYGNVTFVGGGEDCVISNIPKDMVFVSFDDHCVDIINIKDDFKEYLTTDRFAQCIRDSHIDRKIDR